MALFTPYATRILTVCILSGLTNHVAFAKDKNDCGVVNGIESICVTYPPEDIVVVPGGRDLIFSQFHAKGSLVALNTLDNSLHTLYPLSNSKTAKVAATELWGDKNCVKAPEAIIGHGIDLTQRSDGRWQLLLVNHLGRESVEIFELTFGEQSTSETIPKSIPELTWRGCAIAPPLAKLNDVAALPSGGFLTTHTLDNDYPFINNLLSAIGFDRGFVYRWDKDTGYAKVQGTDGRYPNGITISGDETTFFVNNYLGNELRKYDTKSGELLAATDISKPDNMSWTHDGKLLVASHRVSLYEISKVMDDDRSVPSLLPYSIIEVDPNTLQQRLILEGEGEPMGLATVAVELNNHLYLGSFVGDRLIKVPLESK
jgi:hypothetical protein